MGCCGSTVDVREMKRPADASDDEPDAGDWSGATMLLKAEARRLFAIVDEGACPSHEFDPPASRSSIHDAARRAVAHRLERPARPHRAPQASRVDE
eukprot:COSAG03_NODE_14_length_22296_cov_10.813128_17_plen_96_part_00